MSTCVSNLTTLQLNTNLVPTNLRSLTQTQQCSRIQSDANLRRTISDFVGRLRSTKKLVSSAKTGCPLHVWWSTGSQRIVMLAKDQAKYYDFLAGSNNTGFAFLVNKTMLYYQSESTLKKQRAKGSLCPTRVCIC